VQMERSEGRRSGHQHREAHASTWLVKRRVEVSEDIKGGDELGRTGDSVQGSSDGLDVLPTTSILCGFELLDKVRTGWTCAIDDIHDDPRWKRPGEGIK
jgi:hypothetical protein